MNRVLVAGLLSVLLSACGVRVTSHTSDPLDPWPEDPRPDDPYGQVELPDSELRIEANVKWRVVITEDQSRAKPRKLEGAGQRTIDLPDDRSVCVTVTMLEAPGWLRARLLPNGAWQDTVELGQPLSLCTVVREPL
jgi:hypothetical protein